MANVICFRDINFPKIPKTSVDLVVFFTSLKHGVEQECGLLKRPVTGTKNH